MRMIEAVWDLLGKKTCLVFGKECGSACIWMIFSLIVRAIIILIGLEQYIPCGVVFAFPYFIQVNTPLQLRFYLMSLIKLLFMLYPARFLAHICLL